MSAPVKLARHYDVAVIGAGVFGAWTALQLKRSGAAVVLIDQYGPGNSRSSSGGESRIIRMGYGPDEIYTRSAQRSMVMWQELFQQVGEHQLFQPTGVLWLARDRDRYCQATLETFERCEVAYERLDRNELSRRYPQLVPGPVTWGILEPHSGVLMARRAVQAVVHQALAEGVTYLETSVGENGAEPDAERLQTSSGETIRAETFVFACGPWLPKLFPSLLRDLIYVTRQEVFFLGTPPDFPPLPAWIDFNELVYGLPDLEHRGCKIAIDRHGSEFDPDAGDRIVSAEGIAAVRKLLASRIPALAEAPITETRVCQYENTSNGDFLIDRHPAKSNFWIVGGGSGHGFKHGPAVGEHVSALIRGASEVEPRFSFTTKSNVQKRQVY